MSKKLDNVLDKIKKSYKIDTVNAREACQDVIMPLESPGFNFILGGNWKHGYIYYLQGPESGGKSTIATYVASQIQKKYEGHNTVAYLDFEYSFNPKHATELGLDVDNNFLLIRPESGEDGFQIMQQLVDSDEVGLIVLDSITTINSKAMIEDSFKATFGGGAAMLSNGLRGILPHLYNHKCSLILISQERQSMSLYGADFKGTGGRAPGFYSSWMARVTRVGDITDPQTKELIGIECKVRNTKSKLDNPKREAILKVMFHSGINSDDEYFDYLVNLGIVTRSGAWYNHGFDENGKPIEGDWQMHVQGKERMAEFLKSKPELYEKIKFQVNEMIQGHTILDNEDGTSTIVDENGEILDDVWSQYTQEDQ